jgi:hypothetical protein
MVRSPFPPWLACEQKEAEEKARKEKEAAELKKKQEEEAARIKAQVRVSADQR